MKKERPSALLAKYSTLYKKNPRSRVYAPLAEAYRKIGLHDRALEILKEGDAFHPDYLLAKIVTGQCYFDLEKYQDCYEALRSYAKTASENVALHRLFAKVCLKLNHHAEALISFKYLLLINPRDRWSAENIKELEDVVTPTIEKVSASLDDNEDDWVQVSFTPQEIPIVDEIENWESHGPSGLDKFKDEIKQDKLEIKEKSLDDEFYREDYDIDSDDVIAPESLEDSAPLVTDTLIDLYVQQGLLDKALDVIDTNLQKNPDNEQLKAKKQQIDSMRNEQSPSEDFMKSIEVFYDRYLGLINEKFQ